MQNRLSNLSRVFWKYIDSSIPITFLNNSYNTKQTKKRLSRFPNVH